MKQETFITIPSGMDCSIKGQLSPYRKRPPKPNGHGGMTFHSEWNAPSWRKKSA